MSDASKAMTALRRAIESVRDRRPHRWWQVHVGGRPLNLYVDFTAAGRGRLWLGRGPKAQMVVGVLEWQVGKELAKMGVHEGVPVELVPADQDSNPGRLKISVRHVRKNVRREEMMTCMRCGRRVSMRRLRWAWVWVEDKNGRMVREYMLACPRCQDAYGAS